ncbi:MAG: TonB-dependent receptor, partial [Candidatus Omnitrophica bacterium]|nr:TonB-dependent receptor [Candidatus Omnitrophota bacterium]
MRLSLQASERKTSKINKEQSILSIILLLVLVFVACLFSFVASANDADHTLDPIVIVPTKSSLLQSKDSRKINIITAEAIRQLPVQSLPELLEHSLGVDIRQRGAKGVQADVNIRGSNFEQTLICLNGVRINDPQTGHHNMDLPVNLTDIERIEILPGHGSSIYGPGAFSGVINIVTKQPKAAGIELEVTGGRFGFSSQALAVDFGLADINNRISFANKKSSGYRPDTDSELTSLSLNSEREFSFGKLE